MTEWSKITPALTAIGFRGARDAARDLARVHVRMSTDELKEYMKLLVFARKYLEWGAGGSTVVASWVASYLGRPEVRVVDSSKGFLGSLKKANTHIDRAERQGLLRMQYGNIGALSEWGNPSGWTNRTRPVRLQQSLNYVERNHNETCCFDLVLVDGRFRSACLMHAFSLISGPRAIVMVHDSPRYINFARKYYRVMHTVDTLSIMRPRSEFLTASARTTAEWNATYLNALDDRQRRI